MIMCDFDNINPDTDSRWWPKRRVIQACTGNKPLLIRYFLLHTKPLSIFLHHFLQSDEDRALHDHPWSFWTFLLSGGYWEHTQTERLWRPRFSLMFRPAEWQHRVELEKVWKPVDKRVARFVLVEKPIWTLVIKFRSRREWGFIMKDGWMKWSDYLTQWCND
jgi:hypothetical protein